jgi:hypothetical protein
MKKNMGKFEAALVKFLPTDEGEWTVDQFSVAHEASRIDDLRERLADDSRRMAERFAKFAQDTEEGSLFTPPTGYSTLADITANHARLEARIEAFRTLISVFLGEGAKGFWKEVRA